MSSSVQKVRDQIEQEIQAMHTGLYGLASGTARHRFIAARSQRLDQLRDELASHVGETQATRFSCETYVQVTEGR